MTDKMIVLADLGRVKAYRVTYEMMVEKPRIDLVYDCEFPEAHQRLGTRVTDQAGAFPSSSKPGTSVAEDHNLLVETERRLIRLVAGKIEELVRDQKYWHLAAAESINARILEQLSPGARATMLRNIPADLLKIPKQQLIEHFAPAAA